MLLFIRFKSSTRTGCWRCNLQICHYIGALKGKIRICREGGVVLSTMSKPTARTKDNLTRFLIESADVRGSIVQLDDAWVEARQRVEYPPIIQQVLGEAFAATLLLSTTIKFEGKMTLQVRGDGAVHLLVVQVTADRQLRGLARWTNKPTDDSVQALFGANARMSITIEANEFGQPYQGIVELSGHSLSDSLRDYFRNSEQLQTELILAVDEDTAAGMLLQKLPDRENDNDIDPDAWNRTLQLARTLQPEELRDLAAAQQLHRLFHEEQVRLFGEQGVAFHCSCSQARTDGLIQGMGIDEARSILQEQGSITITCEFCDQVYQYDEVDVTALFKTGESPDASELPTLH